MIRAPRRRLVDDHELVKAIEGGGLTGPVWPIDPDELQVGRRREPEWTGASDENEQPELEIGTPPEVSAMPASRPVSSVIRHRGI